MGEVVDTLWQTLVANYYSLVNEGEQIAADVMVNLGAGGVARASGVLRSERENNEYGLISELRLLADLDEPVAYAPQEFRPMVLTISWGEPGVTKTTVVLPPIPPVFDFAELSCEGADNISQYAYYRTVFDDDGGWAAAVDVGFRPVGRLRRLRQPG
jgi:hypothetical protein